MTMQMTETAGWTGLISGTVAALIVDSLVRYGVIAVSSQAGSFIGASAAFVVGIGVAAIVTTFTTSKPDSELAGLVWSLTPRTARVTAVEPEVRAGVPHTPRRATGRRQSSPEPTPQLIVQFLARTDAEFHEHFAQVPFDGARADEQLRTDLRVRPAESSEPGDLGLLRCELLAGVGSTCPCRYAGGEQLPAGPLAESLGPIAVNRS
jgi:hypothetical protein